MLSLTGRSNAGLPPLHVLRFAIVLGVLVFTLSAVALMALGAGFLTFPIAIAKWLILFIETAATLTIGTTLAAAYLAGEPSPPGRLSPQSGGSEP